MVDSSSQILYANEVQWVTWIDALNVMRCLYPTMKWTHIAFKTGQMQHTIGLLALIQNSTMVSNPANTVAGFIQWDVAVEVHLLLFLGPANMLLKGDRQQTVLLDTKHQLQQCVYNTFWIGSQSLERVMIQTDLKNQMWHFVIGFNATIEMTPESTDNISNMSSVVGRYVSAWHWCALLQRVPSGWDEERNYSFFTTLSSRLS